MIPAATLAAMAILEEAGSRQPKASYRHQTVAIDPIWTTGHPRAILKPGFAKLVDAFRLAFRTEVHRIDAIVQRPADAIEASRGSSSHIMPRCFILPASSPAAAPNPQKKSARTALLIAPPVSCAMTRRCKATSLLG